MTIKTEILTKVALAQENARLQALLHEAINALTDIPTSRFQKEQNCPHGDPNDGLVYLTCAQECFRLGRAKQTEILDRLITGEPS